MLSVRGIGHHGWDMTGSELDRGENPGEWPGGGGSTGEPSDTIRVFLI